MRIVGGKHRGRRLEAPAGRDIRPTSDRVREALFNILAHADWGAGGASPLEGAAVLDAFCGTGALALEALSRGAASAVLMDAAPSSLAIARRNAELLNEMARCRLLRADATRPPLAPAPCTLVFLDPPYGKGLAGAALPALAGRGWLAAGAVAAVEAALKDPMPQPDGFDLLDERRYGDTRIGFFRHTP